MQSHSTWVVLVHLIAFTGCKGPAEYEPEDYPEAILPKAGVTHVDPRIEPRRYKATVELELKRLKSPGQIDEKWVRKPIWMRKMAIRNCYNKRVQDNPDLHGEISLVMKFAPDGKLEDIKVQHDEIGDQPIVDCLLTKLGSISTKEPVNGGHAKYMVVMTFNRIDLEAKDTD